MDAENEQGETKEAQEAHLLDLYNSALQAFIFIWPPLSAKFNKGLSFWDPFSIGSVKGKVQKKKHKKNLTNVSFGLTYIHPL